MYTIPARKTSRSRGCAKPPPVLWTSLFCLFADFMFILFLFWLVHPRSPSSASCVGAVPHCLEPQQQQQQQQVLVSVSVCVMYFCSPSRFTSFTISLPCILYYFTPISIIIVLFFLLLLWPIFSLGVFGVLGLGLWSGTGRSLRGTTPLSTQLLSYRLPTALHYIGRTRGAEKDGRYVDKSTHTHTHTHTPNRLPSD